MTPAKYVEMVRNKELVDPILTFQLSNEFYVRKIIRGYLPYDSESKAYATLLEWINVYYEEDGKAHRQYQVQRAHRHRAVADARHPLAGRPVPANRVFCGYRERLQSRLRAVSGVFQRPLMALTNEDSPSVAIRAMAAFTEPIKAKMMELAVSYNINIVAGSMPVYDATASCYNVAFLCRRDGTVDEQYKLHVTPDEASYWGMRGGDKLQPASTPTSAKSASWCATTWNSPSWRAC